MREGRGEEAHSSPSKMPVTYRAEKVLEYSRLQKTIEIKFSMEYGRRQGRLFKGIIMFTDNPEHKQQIFI